MPIAIGTIVTLFVLALLSAGLWGCPQYGVYAARMAGEAELQQAEQNRQIRVREAQAQLDAAHLTAQAEVAKAEGVAQANKIMAESLGGADGYLRWKYIEMLQETGMAKGGQTTIYVPTEASLPILEAGRNTPKAAP